MAFCLWVGVNIFLPLEFFGMSSVLRYFNVLAGLSIVFIFFIYAKKVKVKIHFIISFSYLFLLNFIHLLYNYLGYLEVDKNFSGQVFSALAFLMALILFVSLYFLFQLNRFRLDFFYRFLFFVSVLSGVYLFIDIFSFDSNALVNIYRTDSEFYKNSVFMSTTFFNTTYFSGFFGNFFFSIFLAVYLSDKKVKWLIGCVVFFFVVVFSQSKVSYAVLFLNSFLIYFACTTRHASSKVLLIIVLASIIFWLVFLNDFGNALIGDWYFYKSAYQILFDYQSSGSLNTRFEQIETAYRLISQDNHLIGRGALLGVYMESWVAYYMYKFGVLALLYYVIPISFLIFLSFKTVFLCKRKRNLSWEDLFALSMSVMIITLPLSELSSPMIVNPKNYFLFFLSLSYVIYYWDSIGKGSDKCKS